MSVVALECCDALLNPSPKEKTSHLHMPGPLGLYRLDHFRLPGGIISTSWHIKALLFRAQDSGLWETIPARTDKWGGFHLLHLYIDLNEFLEQLCKMTDARLPESAGKNSSFEGRFFYIRVMYRPLVIWFRDKGATIFECWGWIGRWIASRDNSWLWKVASLTRFWTHRGEIMKIEGCWAKLPDRRCVQESH